MAIKVARNPILAALLLSAFVARALVPAGFMPGAGGLVLCDGYAASAANAMQAMGHDMSAMDMAGAGHGANHATHGGGSADHAGSSLCSFAAAATTMASGHTAILAVFVSADAGQVQLPDLPFIPRGTIVPTRLPRGPPSLA